MKIFASCRDFVEPGKICHSDSLLSILIFTRIQMNERAIQLDKLSAFPERILFWSFQII